MRVSVELPDAKPGLDAALAKQFADLQRQLMGLVKEQESSKTSMHSMMMECMEEQQTKLLTAMESLMKMVGQTSRSTSGTSDALADALRGLKSTLADLPGDLKASLDRSYAKVQAQMTKQPANASKITMQMPAGLTSRLDSLEHALMSRPMGMRNRTFGSNF